GADVRLCSVCYPNDGLMPVRLHGLETGHHSMNEDAHQEDWHMSYSTLISKTVSDTLMSRRTFLKWSAALGGTAVLAEGGLHFGLKKAEAKTLAAPAEGKWVTAA